MIRSRKGAMISAPLPRRSSETMSCPRCGATVAVTGGGVCASCGASLVSPPDVQDGATILASSSLSEDATVLGSASLDATVLASPAQTRDGVGFGGGSSGGSSGPKTGSEQATFLAGPETLARVS